MATHVAPRNQPADLVWDPIDESLKDDAHSLWHRLREEAPLYYNESFDFWALSRFDDVDSAHRDAKTFSSAHGTVLELMTPETIDVGLMIFMDPPDHTSLRRLVSRAFTPRRIAELEMEIRALCAGLLEAQRDRGGFDFVADFGARIPATVIAALLGVPEEDRGLVRALIDRSFHLEPDVGMANDVSLEAMGQLHAYIEAQLSERRAAPRDDMLSDLVDAVVTDPDGSEHRLSLEESTMFAILLASAGTETVARLIGWAGLVLAGHPDQRAELVAAPELIGGAVEELLRFEAPSPVQGRWTTQPLSLYDVTVPAESKVLLLTGSAGRDPRRFPDPDRFDIHRQSDHHLSFGYGIHFCLGAALARMEARVALEEVLIRYPSWTVDMAGAVPLHTSTVRGYSSLPIVT